MKIKRSEIKTFMENLYCEKCDAIMVYKGEFTPPNYKHICLNCNHEVETDKIYPNTEYVYVDVDDEKSVE
jgi:hypothetical protein